MAPFTAWFASGARGAFISMVARSLAIAPVAARARQYAALCCCWAFGAPHGTAFRGKLAGFVAALYGPKEALLSIPRSVIANIIAIMAAHRACIVYARHCFGAPLRWDKTAHHIVPASLVRPD